MLPEFGCRPGTCRFPEASCRINGTKPFYRNSALLSSGTSKKGRGPKAPAFFVYVWEQPCRIPSALRCLPHPQRASDAQRRGRLDAVQSADVCHGRTVLAGDGAQRVARLDAVVLHGCLFGRLLLVLLFVCDFVVEVLPGVRVDAEERFFQQEGSYYFGKNPASISGMKITQLGITDMTYEKSHKLNVGFDFIAFNKLSVTIDGFYDHRTDILVSGDNAVSSIFGLTAPNINNGVVNSYGVETSVRWADKIGDFNYQIGGMLTFNRNKIINQNEEYRPHDYLKRTGKRLGQFFGYEVEGIYQSQEEIDNRGVKQNLSDVRPGDLKYKDQNNDGVIDAYDQVALGYSAMPEIYYSFDLNLEYKGFGIYALFQGTGNQSRLLNTSSVYWPLISNSTISTEYYNNRWTPDTPNAKYPRLTSEGSANNYTTNSLWVADASYMKLRTLELYYNFSQEMMKKSKFIKGAKVFARGHDLFCVDKIKVLDPENIGTNHPTMTQYTFGVNLSF